MIGTVTIDPSLRPETPTRLSVEFIGTASDQIRELAGFLWSAGLVQSYVDATGIGDAFAGQLQAALDDLQDEPHSDDYFHVVPFTPSTPALRVLRGGGV